MIMQATPQRRTSFEKSSVRRTYRGLRYLIMVHQEPFEMIFKLCRRIPRCTF